MSNAYVAGRIDIPLHTVDVDGQRAGSLLFVKEPDIQRTEGNLPFTPRKNKATLTTRPTAATESTMNQ